MQLGSVEFWKRLDEDPKALAAEICSIDLVNLEQTLQHHPALRAWVNAAYESARIVKERADWELTTARARALLHAKAEKDPHTEKHKTGEVLKAEAEVDDVVLRAGESLLQAEYKCAVLKAMSIALEDRTQMLIQLSAKHRQESRDYR